ncbi:MAG: septal ring lytic transglycosylase RlpA family protein [Methylobacter sp.]
MSYQTIQQHNVSSDGVISAHKKLLSFPRVILLVVLVISGCTDKDSGDYTDEKSQQTQQEKVSATTIPVHKEVGEASWYGPGLQGKETSNGETFDQKDMTAAHPSLPMGTKAKVTNLENGKKVDVRINDRGPFSENRIIDLSSAAANKIDMKEDGTTQVKIETKHIRKKGINKTEQAAKNAAKSPKQ